MVIIVLCIPIIIYIIANTLQLEFFLKDQKKCSENLFNFTFCILKLLNYFTNIFFIILYNISYLWITLKDYFSYEIGEIQRKGDMAHPGNKVG